MEPSIGRIVHYESPGHPIGPVAAIITRVWSGNTHVDLTLFPYWDEPKRLGCVQFSEVPKPGHWSWPPRV